MLFWQGTHFYEASSNVFIKSLVKYVFGPPIFSENWNYSLLETMNQFSPL